MPEKRVLLMYIHEYSGHHQAALALAKAFRAVNPKVECKLVDELRYAHPFLERLIQRTYLEIVRKRPEVWEYLYDNPWVLKNTQALRSAIHKSHSKKFTTLLRDFRPDAIVCTQAFPCGIVSDYKATYAYPVPLYGVLTDFFPHSYWVLDHVNRYFVPSQEAKEKLHENGVFENRISVAGIPIDPSFDGKNNFKVRAKTPMVLIMGGSQGMGPIEKIVMSLDKLTENFEMVVLTGRNLSLQRKLNGRKAAFKKKVRVLPYVEDTSELMHNASLLVSKPGGLTIAQALACRLPIIFIDPIPGQEAKNASILLKHRAAVEARSEGEVSLFVGQLLRAPAKIEAMKRSMRTLAYPDAAIQIARNILTGNPLS